MSILIRNNTQRLISIGEITLAPLETKAFTEDQLAPFENSKVVAAMLKPSRSGQTVNGPWLTHVVRGDEEAPLDPVQVEKPNPDSIPGEVKPVNVKNTEEMAAFLQSGVSADQVRVDPVKATITPNVTP